MTVCVAAISNVGQEGGPTIVAASDRMITVNDMEYEPARAKGYHIHRVAFRRGLCFFAGDVVAFTAIRSEVATLDTALVPTNMKDMALLFAKKFAEYRNVLAERKYLSPLGMSYDEFINTLGAVSEEKFAQTVLDLRNFQIHTNIMLTGFDDFGPHIYVVSDPGIAECFDDICFAAIGYGSELAQADFRKVGYTSAWSFDRALLMSYLAKHAAEIAPGVGPKTDMWFLEHTASDWVWMSPEDKVSRLIQKAGMDKKKADQRTLTRIYESHVERLKKARAKTAPPSLQSSVPDQPHPTDAQ